jgi:hypothetical protein
VQGTINFGPEANELIRLIREFGGAQSSQLESAVHELEDVDARTPDRLGAKQRLKAFLFKLGDKAEECALKAFQTYMESKLGV